MLNRSDDRVNRMTHTPARVVEALRHVRRCCAANGAPLLFSSLDPIQWLTPAPEVAARRWELALQQVPRAVGGNGNSGREGRTLRRH